MVNQTVVRIARKIMAAIAGAPAPFRDAVIAADLLGLSYREAARYLRARGATITTRLYREAILALLPRVLASRLNS